MTVVSFFAGCGGLDLGFEQAGYNVIWANEFDAHCSNTYTKNHPNTQLVIGDICAINPSRIPECDGFIGGPPCQSWSIGGQQKGLEDDRGKLFLKYIELINLKKPKFFVIENVKGILSPKFKEVFDDFIFRLEYAGYDVKWKLLDSVDYKVPQNRERIFIIGIKTELKITYIFPKPTSVSPIDLQHAIGDIKEQPIYCSGHQNAIQFTSIPNHVVLNSKYGSFYYRGNRRRGWEKPSFTINASSEFIPLHPSSPKMMYFGPGQWSFQTNLMNHYRRLSVRECARIQTFPDNFIFECDNINATYRMVGNAVPPRLAFEIAKSIKYAFNQACEDKMCQEQKTKFEEYILVGYYKNKKHLQEILNSKLYYVRSDGRKGSLFKIDCRVAPKYLLLHNKDRSELFQLDGEEPVLANASFLKSVGFSPAGDLYLCFRLNSVKNIMPTIFGSSDVELNLKKFNYKPYFTTLNSLINNN